MLGANHFYPIQRTENLFPTNPYIPASYSVEFISRLRIASLLVKAHVAMALRIQSTRQLLSHSPSSFPQQQSLPPLFTQAHNTPASPTLNPSTFLPTPLTISPFHHPEYRRPYHPSRCTSPLYYAHTFLPSLLATSAISPAHSLKVYHFHSRWI